MLLERITHPSLVRLAVIIAGLTISAACTVGPSECRSAYYTSLPNVTVTNDSRSAVTVSGLVDGDVVVGSHRVVHIVGADPAPMTHELRVRFTPPRPDWVRTIDSSDGLVALDVTADGVTFRNRVHPPAPQECRSGQGPWPTHIGH